MKVRSGFVSNSSSTSFLVWIEGDIHSKDEFLEELSKYDTWYGHPMDSPVTLDGQGWSHPLEVDGKQVSNREALSYLWDRLLQSNYTPNKDVWLKMVRSRNPEGSFRIFYPFCDTWCAPHNVADGDEKLEKKLENIGDEWNKIVSQKLIDEIFDEERDGSLYEITFADHDDLGTLMEHGSFWIYVHHLRVSNH